MSFGRDLRSLWTLVELGWAMARAERLALVTRCLLYALILAIFGALWRATPLAMAGRPGLTAERLIWYMAVTEWITFVAGMPYREIEADVRSGAIAVGLGRPVPYALGCLATWCGALGWRLMAFGLVGALTAFFLTGTLPLTASALPGLILSGTLATFSILLWQLAIGLAAIWTGTSAPFYWIWQKTFFVAGGLIVPLDLYPDAVRGAVEASPFAALLWAPASLALDPSPARTASVLGLQLFWLALVGAAVFMVERAAVGRMLEQGV